MIIKFEDTSNINVRNFYPEGTTLFIGTAEFTDAKSLRKSPLAETIFDIGGIESILITSDMVSVTKNSHESWDNLSPQIMAEILDFIAMGAPVVVKTDKDETADDLLKKIECLTDARIRPILHKDGGDIKIIKFAEGILWVELIGKCSGCPYAMRTLKDGVEKILKKYISQIKEVKPFEKG